MKITVTGCAGFIGSTIVDELLKNGHYVFGIDNFSTGKKDFLEKAFLNDKFYLVKDDIKNIKKYYKDIKGSDVVFHMAANADVRFGLNHPSKDLEENTINTFNVLETMRLSNVKKLIFASTGSVYGEASIIPTPEDCPFPIQTSLYGASKLAAEGLIAAYCEGYGFSAVACRFVSLMGPRYTHGHVVDFVKSLKKDSNTLKILGDGSQYKSYFHVKDCMEAMLLLSDKLSDDEIKGFLPLNLGTKEGIRVKDSAKIICESLGYNPEFIFSGGNKGWIGDNPSIELKIDTANKLGWYPKKSIRESIAETAKWVFENDFT